MKNISARCFFFKIILSIAIFFITAGILSAQVPFIASFAPASGPVGTAVTIAGTNFNTTTTNNIVWFGAVQATVTAATATELTVTVPTGATYQPITVTDITTGLTAYSSAPFIVTFPSSQVIDATSFASNIDFSVPGPYTQFLTTGDIDGDGKPDIAVANISNNTISVYRNISTTGSISTGSFENNVDFATGAKPTSIAIGDIDGDGKPDLVVPNLESNTISIFRNTSTSGSVSTGSLATNIDFTTGINPQNVAIGDIDGDGKPDIAVTNQGGNTISIFRNISTSGTITTSSLEAKVDLETGTVPLGIAIGDIDGDGKPDIAVTNSTSNTFSVFRNISTSGSISTGSFEGRVDFTTGTTPFDIKIGDLDKDGKPDIAVTNFDSNTISLFRNISSAGTISTSSFETKADFATGTNPRFLSIGDLDSTLR